MQQIKHFPRPQCQLGKNSEQPWQIFRSPSFVPIFSNQLRIDPCKFPCYDIRGEHFKAPTFPERQRWYPQRFGGKCNNSSPQPKYSQLKVSERRKWPQTQLRDTVTGLFNTKRRPFLWRPVRSSAADFSSLAAFKVQKIRKMENDTWGKQSTLVQKQQTAVKFPKHNVYLDFLSFGSVFFFPLINTH